MILTWCLYRVLILTDKGDNAASVPLLTIPPLLLAIIVTYVEWNIVPQVTILQTAPSIIPENSVNGLPYFDAVFVRYLLFAGWGILFWSVVRNRSMKQTMGNNRRLEKVTRESEIKALRFQLNPHFVFNALNSVSSLIVENKNPQAEKLVDGLADYMRDVLTLGDGQFVTIEQEIAQQIRYLEIEKVRFPNRLHFEATVSEVVREWTIPALIIQPLIENAIKYGVAKSTSPVSILIDARLVDGRLNLSVSNNGRMIIGANADSGTGTGLINVRERLAAIYGSTAALITGNSRANMITASIVIPGESQILQDA
ncbi:sensor histidine kinase [Parasphingorhabdus halotolerans]|uniref:Histidine kinase n=1 Tax=Parasphingorhabdus halotolerans TaxID=2725558 RepID=A0A6H2DQT6_9SPHN|nr:histidine kinase [Parasphingorhabdus halotolerans]QJB70343.1 histidine kinase [Parasphingorhabdus halotolerans]